MHDSAGQKQKSLSASKVNKSAGYLHALAASLIDFASKDLEYAKELFSIVRTLPFGKRRPSDTEETIRTTVPLALLDYEAAVRRTIWITDLFRKRGNQGEAVKAAGLLLVWADTYEQGAPKSLVVGIIGLAIPGITMGLIKRRVSASLILDSERTSGIGIWSVQPSVKALLGLFERELEIAGHDLDKLEPEYADWIYGDRLVNFYTASTEVVGKCLQEFEDRQLPYGSSWAGGYPAALALSPVVNIHALDCSKELKVIARLG